MKVIDIYSAYYAAECVANGRPRHAARVTLTATSDAGMITYELGISFFPHDDEEDFAVSYDAYVSEVIYQAKGRRSAKREKPFLASIEERGTALAASIDGKVFWDQLLREPQYA